MLFVFLFKSFLVRKNEDDNNYMVIIFIKTYRIIYICMYLGIKVL